MNDIIQGALFELQHGVEYHNFSSLINPIDYNFFKSQMAGTKILAGDGNKKSKGGGKKKEEGAKKEEEGVGKKKEDLEGAKQKEEGGGNKKNGGLKKN